MAKTQTKSKFDLGKFLLHKGEYLALGIAAFFLVLLLGWGVSRGLDTKDPGKISDELKTSAQRVHSGIQSGTISEADMKPAEPPPWLAKPDEFKNIPVTQFAVTGPLFDPIAKPDTKKENPVVLPIGEYQADRSLVSMRGYDIQYLKDGEPPQLAVIVSKSVNERDKDKLKDLGKKIGRRVSQGQDAWRNQNNRPQQPGMGMPMGGGPMGGFPMGGGPMGGFPMGGGRFQGSPGMPGNPYGGMGHGFDANAQRPIEKGIEYISLDDLDKAIGDGKVPAMTVIPLRMITIHAEIPYKRQLEEIKRALRLPNTEEARKWGPIYDGYEVQRRVTRLLPGEKVPEVIVDWPTDGKPNYAFEDKYVELINSRKLADNFEDGYLSHFIRYDMALALPLPQLVEELGLYPKLRLPSILETIKKMKEANKPPVTDSDLKHRIGGNTDRSKIYNLQTGQDTGAEAFYGAGAIGGPTGMMKPPGGKPPMGSPPPSGMPPMTGGPMTGGPTRPGDSGFAANAPPIEIEQLLLRFVDVAVEPGYSYEYRIRLRMLNPNHGRDKEIARPIDANVKELYSPWAQIDKVITIPTESFLYAADPLGYRKKIDEEYKDQKDLHNRLQVKDNQAVVEMCTWMEEVRTDGKRREPVGAWVVADMPVGRGEYLGRKTYLKLPLWSSETNQYVLREIADKIVKGSGGKEASQPKGWLVDFSTKSVLVDFEGGKVKTKIGSKEVVEDVATEMLIVRADGKLIVKKSLEDEADEFRTKTIADWEKWIKTVTDRKSSGGKDDNEFTRPKGGKD